MRCSTDPDDNLDPRASRASSTRPSDGAQLVCLPELFRTPVLLPDARITRYFDLAEPIPGPTTEALAKAAARAAAS